jgi:hypothetical protein
MGEEGQGGGRARALEPRADPARSTGALVVRRLLARKAAHRRTLACVPASHSRVRRRASRPRDARQRVLRRVRGPAHASSGCARAVVAADDGHYCRRTRRGAAARSAHCRCRSCTSRPSTPSSSSPCRRRPSWPAPSWRGPSRRPWAPCWGLFRRGGGAARGTRRARDVARSLAGERPGAAEGRARKLEKAAGRWECAREWPWSPLERAPCAHASFAGPSFPATRAPGRKLLRDRSRAKPLSLAPHSSTRLHLSPASPRVLARAPLAAFVLLPLRALAGLLPLAEARGEAGTCHTCGRGLAGPGRGGAGAFAVPRARRAAPRWRRSKRAPHSPSAPQTCRAHAAFAMSGRGKGKSGKKPVSRSSKAGERAIG